MEIEKETTGEGERRRSIGEELPSFIQAHHVEDVEGVEMCGTVVVATDVLEIIYFKKSLPADNTYATQNQLLPSSSQSFSAQSSAAGSQMSPEGRSYIKQTFGKAPPYECKITKHKIEVPILRIDVQVHDGDDNAKFVFWDNTCIELMGITAGELQKNMLEAGEDDLLLDEMMGRTFAFRVKWQKEWRQGPVLEIKDDKQLAGKIQQQRCR
ncbi:hypothetical protein P8452_57443 [Trifolium repens]|nr:hypothetical protein P8452_57443 [Trifolium repens]